MTTPKAPDNNTINALTLQEAKEITCTLCNELKHENEFSADSRKANGKQSRCKPCAAKEKKAWRTKYPERRRAIELRYSAKNPLRHIRTKFGIDPTVKTALFEAQGKCCAACGSVNHGNPKNIGENGWCLDHDHETNKIRGVLCWSCNMALGYVKDSQERLLGLITYLNGNAALNTLTLGVRSILGVSEIGSKNHAR